MDPRQIALFLLFVAVLTGCIPDALAADSLGLITRGLVRTLGAVFTYPWTLLTRSTKAFPLGLVGGPLSATYKLVTQTVGGGLDIARGAAPYAKYMVFFI